MKGGTSVTNFVPYAMKEFENKTHTSVVWSGFGGGVVKTISCAEIMKRQLDLHQNTKLSFVK